MKTPVGPLALAMALVVATACGTRGSQDTPAAAGSTSTVQRVDLVYKLGGPTVGGAAPLAVRGFDPITGLAVAPEQILGSYVTGQEISPRLQPAETTTNGQDSHATEAMSVVNATGEVDTAFLGRGTVARSAGNLLPVTALMPAGGWLEARNQDVLQFDDAGRQVRSFHVATPPPGTPTLNGSPLPGRFSAQIVRIGALLVGRNNDHVYAFVDNSVNSMILDVQTGRSAPIVGFGTVLDAAEGRDGTGYALVFDPSRSNNTYVIVAIDLQSLRLLRQVDTGIRPDGGLIDDQAHVVVDARGTVWAYASQIVNGQASHVGQLLRATPDLSSSRRVAVPANIGFRVVAALDGRLYFYGGPAQNVVTVFDSTSERSTSLAARSPDGSFIVAVFVR